MDFKQFNIGFCGCGAMGGAILAGIIDAGLTEGAKVWVSDPAEKTTTTLANKYGVNVAADNAELFRQCQLIILAVKPYLLPQVLAQAAPQLGPQHQLISIAAGVTTKQIEQVLPLELPVIRVMPNTPCLVGAGATALCGGQYTQNHQLELARALFAVLGLAVVVQEEQLNAVTGLSGSGPAYIYMIIEALADGGVKAGLPRAIATALAAQTVMGAAQMVQQLGEHPAKLKDMVTTPGGTTIAGLYALEQAGLRGTLMEAVLTATQRAQELSKE